MKKPINVPRRYSLTKTSTDYGDVGHNLSNREEDNQSGLKRSGGIEDTESSIEETSVSKRSKQYTHVHIANEVNNNKLRLGIRTHS